MAAAALRPGAGHVEERAFGAFGLALFVHLAFVVLIAVGISFESRRDMSGPIVNARLVENFTPRETAATPPREETPEAKPAEVKPQDNRAERLREQREREAAEAARRETARKEAARQEAARKEALAEKRRADDAARQEAARRAELMQREQAQRALQKGLAAEERARAESALRDRLKTEAASLAQARASGEQSRAQSEIARFEALIRQKVERNWLRPAQSAGGLSCVVRLRIAPGGEVLSAVIVRGSGDAAFDRSVEAAVLRASPLPVPSDLSVFEHFRDLELKFKPED
jgi:colicin import membrane protein